MNTKQARAYYALTRESSSAMALAESRRSVVMGTILGVGFNALSLQLFNDLPQMKISVACSLCQSEGWGNECQQRPAAHCLRGGRIEEAVWADAGRRAEIEVFVESVLKEVAVTHSALDPLGQALILPELTEQLTDWHLDLCAISGETDEYRALARERAAALAARVEEAIGPAWRELRDPTLK